MAELRPSTVEVDTAMRPIIAPRRTKWWRRLVSEGGSITVIAFVLYLVVAMLLDFKYFIFPGDAMSRMANGFYVLYSRDPHLAAIGFVWTPLPSIVDIFFLLFKGLWPALATHDVAGSLMSVFAMAGAVYQLWATLVEWAVPRLPRLVLVALFALNPMIVYYSANGMSEALYVFTLVATTRYLLRWLRHPGSLRPLVYSGAMLALAFLGRNEAVAAAALGTVLVFTITHNRTVGTRHQRVMAATTDGTVFVMPFAATFGAWAISGYVITHQLLAQFSVNNLQVSIAGIRLSSASSRFIHEVHAMSYIGPLLPVSFLLAIGFALKRHDPQPWAIVCILGGCLAFSLVSYLDASIFPWFRFYILAVPIEVLLVGYVLSRTHVSAQSYESLNDARQLMSPRHSVPSHSRRVPILVSAVGVLATLVIVGPSIPSTVKGMLNSVNAPEETQDLGFVFHRKLTAEDISSKDHYAHIVSISRYIGDMHLPNGSVLVDNTVACIPEIIVTSPNAKVFVIPNDRDYLRVLADPLTFHAHFILVPYAVGLAAVNAINKEYPGIYKGNQSFVRLDHSFAVGANCPAFRLFRVVTHTGL